jgi:outer membrane protein insertion porin family
VLKDDNPFWHRVGNAAVLTFPLIFWRMRTPWKSSFSRAGSRYWGNAVAKSLGTGMLVCVLVACPSVCAQGNQIEGRRVSEIRILDQSGHPVSVKTPALPLDVSKPFDFGEERESLRVLYRTGDFADIRVTAAPAGDGLRVDFVVRRNFYNNVVRVEGLKEPPSEAAAQAAMRLSLGEPFRESSLREAIDRLKDTLRNEGLYQADVKWAVTPHEDTRQMDVLVTVLPGPRAVVGNFNVKNNTPYKDAELILRSKVKLNKPLTSARLTRASQKLKKYLVNQGYLGAGILITAGTYNAQTNLVTLNYEVTAGPRVSVTIMGASIGTGKLRQLLPIYAEGAVDEDLLQEGRRNIRDYFQRQGYFDVDVQVSSHDDSTKGLRVINYTITRGDRFRLAGVGFTGNKYFGKDLLAGRLALQPASFAFSGRFSQSLVRDDAESIRALYLANGFTDAKVATTIDDNYQGKKGNLFVTFQIVEGPQTLVKELRIEGNHALILDTLLAVVGSSPGQPYSIASVSSDRNNILAMYYNEGFPEARFDDSIAPADKPNEVLLTYRITEGQRIDVAKVLLTGYQYTRPGIIARQVVIKSNGPLREGDVVESQRRLYNLGVFTRVQIAPQNPAGTDPDKTMVVDVQEGGRYTLGYGFGFEVQRIAASCSAATRNTPACNPNATEIAASPRGIIEISRANMFGRAQTLTFKARASTLQYRSLLSYSADNFLGKRALSASLTGYADKTQDVDTFTSIRYEAAFQITEKLSTSSSLQYRYFFRRVVATNINDTISPEEIPLYSQPTLASGFAITYARDRRDNPGDPKSGTFNTADVSFAWKTLGSSADFYRIFVQNSSFHAFGRNFVFARSTRFGVEPPFGNTQEIEIPLPERFFAGGAQSLRGFSLNQAGPRDPGTGFPIGGLALLIFNQELHFPMRLPFIGNRLGGTLFYDAGNVYSDVNHITLAWKSASPTELNYLSHTVGFGFRYATPIGPVRVDFGYLINPAEYSVTPTPPTVPATQMFHVSHFGFSFNIGPVF